MAIFRAIKHLGRVSLLLVGVVSSAVSQTTWTLVDDPSSALSSFTTIFPYVGTAFVDINADNLPDLFASPRTMFVNNGDGTFRTPLLLPFIPRNGTAGSSWADLDNDGDNDCIIACTPSKVFFNNGNGAFSDSSEKLASFDFYGSWAAAIGDMNEDPLLDLIFAHARGFHPPSDSAPCKLFVQRAPGFTTDAVGGYPFLTELAAYTCPYWSDYDLDGDMDLFIASGPASGVPDFDFCYKNMKRETGQDTLIRMTSELFAIQKQDGQCYNFIDYDNDGDLDLCLTNYYSVPTQLYRNTDGVYESVVTPFKEATTNIANCWGDYDNDGDLDVIITNDNRASKTYINTGNGTFDFSPDGFTTSTAVCSIANADYDNDGDLDVFAHGIGNNGNTSSVGLYRNELEADWHWLNLQLTGVESNRSAIGAIVRIKSLINGKSTWQMREVNAQNSFQGQNDLRVHFGTCESSVVDSIRIIWPLGKTESFTNLTANTFYEITEGLGINALDVRQPISSHNLHLSPNPASNFLTLMNVTADKQRYQIIDIDGRIAMQGQIDLHNPTLNISSLVAGTYFICIFTESGTSSYKFIRE